MRPNVRPLITETYLAVVKNSVGAGVWRNFYAEVNGDRQDIMRDGDLSCAFFVSSVLALFGLVNRVHGTVDGVLADMHNSDWQQVSEPEVGSVLVWEAIKDGRGESHKHIGFYLGNGKAISNSSRKRVPAVHHWTFGKRRGKPARKIEAVFRHPKLR